MEKFSSLLLTGLALNAFSLTAIADGISFHNNTATPLYMAVKSTPYDGYSANSQIGWIRDGKTGVMRSNDDFLTNLGINAQDSYVLGFYNADTDTFGDCGEVISGTYRDFNYENGSCVEVSQETIKTAAVFDSGVMGCSGINISAYNDLHFNNFRSNENYAHKQLPFLRTLHANADITLQGKVSVFGNVKSGGSVILNDGARVLSNINQDVRDNLTGNSCDLLNLESYLIQYRVSQEKSHLVADKKMLSDLVYTGAEFFRNTFKEQEITPTGEKVEVYKVNNLDINGVLLLKEGNVHIHVANDFILGEQGAISVGQNANLTLFVEGDVDWAGDLSSRDNSDTSKTNFALYTAGKSVQIKSDLGGLDNVIYAPNAHVNIENQHKSFTLIGAIHADKVSWHNTSPFPSFISYMEELSDLFKIEK